MVAQLILLALLSLRLGYYIMMHRIPRNGKYNLWSAVVDTSSILLLLYIGGFWDVFDI